MTLGELSIGQKFQFVDAEGNPTNRVYTKIRDISSEKDKRSGVAVANSDGGILVDLPNARVQIVK